MSKYQQRINTRRFSNTTAGRFRGGKLAPVMAEAIRPNESAILSQQITMELDPIAGRMITPITAEFISVFVPVQAIDALKNPEEDYSGNTEVLREKLLSGNPLFGLEEEGELSERMGINPQSIGGVKKVCEITRLAHNAAVNHLRMKKYVNAAQLLASNMDVTPAIIGQTVLDRLNGVLDPEDRVNGSVQLEFGEVQLPVNGIGFVDYSFGSNTTDDLREVDGIHPADPTRPVLEVGDTHGSNSLGVVMGPGNLPKIYADLDSANAGRVSLTDFYNAELMDNLVREMRVIVDQNPEYGEEMVARFAHGMSVDTGKVPFVIHQSQKIFGNDYRPATDGPNLDVAQSDMSQVLDFTVPVPPTELGGMVVTFATVKPDETLKSQPHPILSEPWGVDNFISDELARDPVPVTIRQLNSDCSSGDEGTVALYVGYNGLKRSYINYGFNRHLDTETVDAKTAIWQLEIPMSVTPQSVLYPADISHYPFADQLAEVCTYVCSSNIMLSTPMIFGPTPVEELAQIETSDLFEDAD